MDFAIFGASPVQPLLPSDVQERAGALTQRWIEDVFSAEVKPKPLYETKPAEAVAERALGIGKVPFEVGLKVLGSNNQAGPASAELNAGQRSDGTYYPGYGPIQKANPISSAFGPIKQPAPLVAVYKDP